MGGHSTVRRHPGIWLCGLVALIAVIAGCGMTDQSRSAESSASASTTPTTPPGAARLASEALSTIASLSKAPRYPGCRNPIEPRSGVNTPLRLMVRSPCIQVHGLAGCIYVDKGDGDTHIALLLSARDAARYLTPGNRAWGCNSDQGSDTAPRLVVEVIPQHCVIRSDNCADRGHFTDPKIPRNGQHVTITGAWVQDTSTFHGRTQWSEIHPAWKITVDKGDPGVPVQNGGNFARDGGD